MRNRIRGRAAVAALLVALAVPAGTAVAKPGGNGEGAPPGQARAEAARAAAQERKATRQGDAPDTAGPKVVPPGWARAAGRVAGKPATLTGSVVEAGGGSVTVAVKGGHPVFRMWAWANGTPDAPAVITVTLAEGAVVRVDGVEATLAEVAKGQHVSARGIFTEGSLAASRLNAATPDADDEAEGD